jgi:hypothetical protein
MATASTTTTTTTMAHQHGTNTATNTTTKRQTVTQRRKWNCDPQQQCPGGLPNYASYGDLAQPQLDTWNKSTRATAARVGALAQLEPPPTTLSLSCALALSPSVSEFFFCLFCMGWVLFIFL